MNDRPPEKLLSADAIAERLAVPASWVYAEARAGRLPSVRLGRYVRFRWSAVEVWLQDLESGDKSPYRRYAPGGSK